MTVLKLQTNTHNPFSPNLTKWSNTQTIRRIAGVCLTILWGWRLKRQFIDPRKAVRVHGNHL